VQTPPSDPLTALYLVDWLQLSGSRLIRADRLALLGRLCLKKSLYTTQSASFRPIILQRRKVFGWTIIVVASVQRISFIVADKNRPESFSNQNMLRPTFRVRAIILKSGYDSSSVSKSGKYLGRNKFGPSTKTKQDQDIARPIAACNLRLIIQIQEAMFPVFWTC